VRVGVRVRRLIRHGRHSVMPSATCARSVARGYYWLAGSKKPGLRWGLSPGFRIWARTRISFYESWRVAGLPWPPLLSMSDKNTSGRGADSQAASLMALSQALTRRFDKNRFQVHNMSIVRAAP